MGYMDRYQTWLRGGSSGSGILSGALRMETDEEGRVVFAPVVGDTTKRFRSIDEGNAYMDTFGVTRAHTKQYGYRSRTTPALVRNFQEFMEQTGGRVELYSFRPESDAQKESLRGIVQRDEQLYGWMFPDDETTTLMRAWEGGRELTTDELISRLEGKYGFDIPDLRLSDDVSKSILGMFDEKFVKRAKAPVTSKMFEMLGDPIKIGIMDSSVHQNLSSLGEYFDGFWDRTPEIHGQYSNKQDFIKKMMEQAADDASDGISVVSKELLNRVYSANMKFLNELQTDYADAMAKGRISAARDLMGQIDSLRRDLSSLSDTIDRGHGVANTRVMGGNVFKVTGPGGDTPRNARLDRILEDMGVKGWQIKGNAVLDDAAAIAAGADFLTDMGNVNFEFGFAERRLAEGNDMQTLFTWSPFESSSNVIIDEQSIASNADVFSREYLQSLADQQLEDFDKGVRALQETGTLPQPFIAQIKSMAESPNRQTAARASNVLAMIDSGVDLRIDPSLMKEALKTLERSMFRKNRFKVHLPNATRAEIVPHWIMKGREGVRDMVPAPYGQEPELQSHRQSGTFIMHEADAVRFRAAFGGFDFDDAINNMARFDSSTGDILSLAIRQPNSAAEYVLARVHRNDDMILGAIAKAQKLDLYKGANDTIQKSEIRVNNLTAQLRRLERQFEEARGDHRQQLRIQQRIQRIGDNLTQAEDTLESARRTVKQVLEETIEPIDDIASKISRPSGRTGSIKIPLGNNTFRYEGDPKVYHDAFIDQKALTQEKIKQAILDTMGAERAVSGESFTISEQLTVYNRMIGDDIASQNLIGYYVNPQMVVDDWRGVHGQVIQERGSQRLQQMFQTPFLETEALIDVAKDKAQVSAEADNIVKQMIKTIVYGKAEGLDIGIDPNLYKERISAKQSLVQAAIKEANEELGREVIDPASVINPEKSPIFMGPDQARFNVIKNAGKAVEDRIKLALGEVRQIDSVMNFADVKDRSTTELARRILKTSRASINNDMDDYGRNIAQYDASQRMLSMLVQETFEGDEAGEKTYKTILRMMQLVEGDERYSGVLRPLSYINARGVIGSEAPGLSEGGMSRAAYQWLQNQIDPEAAKPIPTIIARDVEYAMEALTGDNAFRALDEILQSQDIPVTARMVQDIELGLAQAYGDSGERLPRSAAQFFDKDSPFNRTGRIGRLMSNATLFGGADDVDLDSLNSLLYQYTEATDETHRAKIADHISKTVIDTRNNLLRYVSEDPDAPAVLRDYVFRSFERAAQLPGQDAESLDFARQFMATQEETVSGGRYIRMGIDNLSDAISKVGGAKLGIGAAAVVGLAMINKVRRKDHTLEDIQGPAFMPGGTPYSEDFPMDTAPPMPAYAPAQDQGVTYQVRGRGGNYDSSMVDAINEITGGNVTGSTYDGSLPFQSENARDQLLRMYG